MHTDEGPTLQQAAQIYKDHVVSLQVRSNRQKHLENAFVPLLQFNSTAALLPLLCNTRIGTVTVNRENVVARVPSGLPDNRHARATGDKIGHDRLFTTSGSEIWLCLLQWRRTVQTHGARVSRGRGSRIRCPRFTHRGNPICNAALELMRASVFRRDHITVFEDCSRQGAQSRLLFLP
jgi:hypothetical protein